jgi:Ca-activated chloride channel homolog
MKVLATFLLTLLFLTDPTLVGKVNTMKSEAKKAYLKNDFKAAVKTYRYLLDSLHVREDEVMLNLASAYYNLKDTANALSQYQSLTQSPKNYLRSKAQQQLGLIADQQGKPEEALNHFKQAIKSDLSNQEARYNYELVKKKLEEQKKQDQQNKDKNEDKRDQQKDQEKKDEKNQDQQKKDQEQKEKEQKEKEQKEKEQKEKEQQKKDQEKDDKGEEQKKKEEQEKKEQEKKDLPPSVKEKLEQMQISEEKAKMLLDAMRAQEVQYLQQNKRKATKPKEKGKPDW